MRARTGHNPAALANRERAPGTRRRERPFALTQRPLQIAVHEHYEPRR